MTMPIEDCAILGDTQTAAPVSRDGSIDCGSCRGRAALFCLAVIASFPLACAGRTSDRAVRHPEAERPGIPRDAQTGAAVPSAPPVLPVAAPETAGAFMDALEKGSSAARKLATVSGHDAAKQASIVMSALAEAIDKIPGASERVADQITELRFEAQRLDRADRMSFSLAHWIQEGLVAALKALEALSPSNEPAAFWIRQARSAARAIDENSGLAFQRAIVQDAIRATLDAFVVLGRGPAASNDCQAATRAMVRALLGLGRC
jgi:hypothetical protein